MTTPEFQSVVTKRLDYCEDLLGVKGSEYSSNDDRLHNFRIAAKAGDSTMIKAAWGMYLKHYASIYDMVHSDVVPTEAMIKEKVSDAINYHLLFEAIWEDERVKEI